MNKKYEGITSKVTVNREIPEPPPIKDVTIVLSEDEAKNLSTLLMGGVSAATIRTLGLTDIQRELDEKVGQYRKLFKSIAHFA